MRRDGVFTLPNLSLLGALPHRIDALARSRVMRARAKAGQYPRMEKLIRRRRRTMPQGALYKGLRPIRLQTRMPRRVRRLAQEQRHPIIHLRMALRRQRKPGRRNNRDGNIRKWASAAAKTGRDLITYLCFDSVCVQAIATMISASGAEMLTARRTS